MAKKKTATPILSDDEDGGKTAMGCLGALIVLVGVGGAAALFVEFDKGDTSDNPVAGGLPITKVEALDKSAADQAANRPLARNLEPGDDAGRVAGRATVINDLFADFHEHGIEPEDLTRELDRRAVCYNGRHAQLAPLILAPDTKGFAMTFGTRTPAEGDPFPRLEFSHGIAGDLDYVYYVSLTREPVRGFEPKGIRIPNTRKAVGRVMLDWVAEVANTACPAGPS